MIVARYTEPDEFMHDLACDVDDVERRVVRLTKMARSAGPGGSLTRVTVCAGAVVGGRLVKLESYIGDLWGSAADDKVQAQATQLVKDLEERIADLGLQLRAGFFEERG